MKARKGNAKAIDDRNCCYCPIHIYTGIYTEANSNNKFNYNDCWDNNKEFEIREISALFLSFIGLILSYERVFVRFAQLLLFNHRCSAM